MTRPLLGRAGFTSGALRKVYRTPRHAEIPLLPLQYPAQADAAK